MIRIVNLANYKPTKGEILIKVDRSNKILGNKFIMKNESERDYVCDKYQEWFYTQIKENNKDVIEELNKIKELSLNNNIALGCWCYPKRCHAQTIKKFLEVDMVAKKESTIKSKRPTFKVIIAGGRNFNDYERLKRDCDKLLINKRNMGYRIIIISGTAQGADTLGEQYAKEKGYEVLRFPADWTTYGKKAGYIRNIEMSQHADACICFWDNFSRGTRHMIETARKKGIPTRISYYVDNRSKFI